MKNLEIDERQGQSSRGDQRVVEPTRHQSQVNDQDACQRKCEKSVDKRLGVELPAQAERESGRDQRGRERYFSQAAAVSGVLSHSASSARCVIASRDSFVDASIIASRLRRKEHRRRGGCPKGEHAAIGL